MPFVRAAFLFAFLIENMIIDTEYVILENIYDSAGQQIPLRQRDLAQIAGASLGMTNSILKRLVQKGWITVKKINKRNIQYAVTIDGINEIIHRSYRYFKRTIRNVVFYKEILEDLISKAGCRNINTVVLVGTSDLDFIVEHACRRCGLSFVRNGNRQKTPEIPFPDTLEIYSESITKINENLNTASSENAFYLSSLIIKQAASDGSAAYGA
jgi:DNA-binding MarR family transcriptional regulator